MNAKAEAQVILGPLWSLRGTELPTVATPVTWDEVEAGTLAHATYDEALRRLRDGIDPTSRLRRPGGG